MSASNRWWRDYDAECEAFDEEKRLAAVYVAEFEWLVAEADEFEAKLVVWLGTRATDTPARAIIE